jgi:hypothetical protein
MMNNDEHTDINLALQEFKHTTKPTVQDRKRTTQYNKFPGQKNTGDR